MIIYAKPIILLEIVPRDLITRTRSPPRAFIPWPPYFCQGWPFGSTTYIRRDLIFIIFFLPSYSTFLLSPLPAILLLLPAGPRVVSFASGPVGLSNCVCYREETLVAVPPGKPALFS